MTILNDIYKNKKKEIEFDKNKYSINTLEKIIKIEENRGFNNLLIKNNRIKKNNIIGEIKKASPSAGIIVNNYDPISIASIYEKSGIGALSILTDKKYFKGNIEHISSINKKIKLPILRKDFIIDPYQVIQSKYYKADAILIIMSILSLSQARELIDVSQKYKIDCLVEVHDINEIDNALKLNNPTIGINNRNLKNLEVNLVNTEELYKEIPNEYTVIAESGIKTKRDITNYNKLGIYNFLIGESLLRSNDIHKKINELIC